MLKGNEVRRSVLLMGVAMVMIASLQGLAKGADVAYTVEITDVADADIVQAAPGDQFKAWVYVQDLRGLGATGGVFTGYADLTYDLDYVDWSSIVVDPFFGNAQSGTIVEANRLVDEAGGMDGFTPPGDSRQLLFTVTGQVHNSCPYGVVTFSLSEAGISPTHDTLVFGSNDAVTDMTFGQDTLIVPEPASLSLLALGGLVALRRRRKTKR